jgi:hypothetical protein
VAIFDGDDSDGGDGLGVEIYLVNNTPAPTPEATPEA